MHLQCTSDLANDYSKTLAKVTCLIQAVASIATKWFKKTIP